MAFYDLPGITLLTHSPQGIRVELNFDQNGLLELWISPRPAASRDYRDRNFSNRDDHTRLFDRIALPGLSQANFVKCDYDAFHVVAHFKQQTLHVVPLVDAPAVLVWVEQPQRVDFKTDKQDSPGKREPQLFTTNHPDRGLSFQFITALGKGGKFIHQPTLDTGRSVYASVDLLPEQTLIIGGALQVEQKTDDLVALAKLSPAKLVAANEKRIVALTSPGNFKLKNLPDLQRLLDVNRRVLAAMQDHSGAVRAALNRIYYLIWVRDGSMIEVFNAFAGNADALVKWTDFLLSNPTEIEHPAHKGKSFLMLVNKITKWEEDGIFFAIWSTFMTWTQTADPAVISPQRLKLLSEVMAWLERYCFDAKRGLFGRYFYCETPLPGSHDDGFDGAVGNATGKGHTRIDGKLVRRSFDIYVNHGAYSSYVMLAAMNKGKKATDYLAKAHAIAEKMRTFFKADGALPDYGDLLLEDGSIHRAGPYGLDLCDYVWSLTLPPFSSEPAQMNGIRQHLFDKMMGKPENYFLASWFSLLSSLDLETFSEEDLHSAINYAAVQCHRPGKFLAMPDTVVEMTDMPDGHLWHDVRPQAFSVGPWLATMTGTGLRRLPFGLAVRPNNTLEKITSYQYKGVELDVQYKGTGSQLKLTLNKQPVTASWQLPETLLYQGKNTVLVELSEPSAATPSSAANSTPLLLQSTNVLLDITDEGSQITYTAASYGLCQWCLRNLDGWTAVVLNAKGKPIQHTTKPDGEHGNVWLLAEARGSVSLVLKRSV
ncbi:MAG: hypothetical protein SFY80_10380 [Verrucomicrobiota bacterium]|nr:hypothetical protein [Verrucomicrobiota bacterium]